MNPDSVRFTVSAENEKYYLIIICVLAALGSLLFFPVSSANGLVLLSDEELQQVKNNLTAEPLQSYFQRLQRGDGGSAAPVLYLLTGEKRYAAKAKAGIERNLSLSV